MAKKRELGEEEVSLKPIGLAIEEAQAKLKRIGKGNPRAQEKIDELTGIHALVKMVCGRTYGRTLVDPCD
jgi:hypothetical protein